jgi:hypothetical protein
VGNRHLGRRYGSSASARFDWSLQAFTRRDKPHWLSYHCRDRLIPMIITWGKMTPGETDEDGKLNGAWHCNIVDPHCIPDDVVNTQLGMFTFNTTARVISR